VITVSKERLSYTNWRVGDQVEDRSPGSSSWGQQLEITDHANGLIELRLLPIDERVIPDLLKGRLI
jgi:hypothetical protein